MLVIITIIKITKYILQCLRFINNWMYYFQFSRISHLTIILKYFLCTTPLQYIILVCFFWKSLSGILISLYLRLAYFKHSDCIMLVWEIEYCNFTAYKLKEWKEKYFLHARMGKEIFVTSMSNLLELFNNCF